jgi:hypothetical protein
MRDLFIFSRSLRCPDRRRSIDVLAPGVVRKERMMLSRRLILMIALMVLHSEVNAVLASPVPSRSGMPSGPGSSGVGACVRVGD